jgi:hypothetical protein
MQLYLIPGMITQTSLVDYYNNICPYYYIVKSAAVISIKEQLYLNESYETDSFYTTKERPLFTLIGISNPHKEEEDSGNLSLIAITNLKNLAENHFGTTAINAILDFLYKDPLEDTKLSRYVTLNFTSKKWKSCYERTLDVYCDNSLNIIIKN